MKQNLIIFITVFTIYVVGDSIYKEINKEPTSCKAKRLECQKSVTAFERGFIIDDIKKAQDLVKSGDVIFTSTIEKSIYAESKLFEYVSLKNTDKIVQNQLDKYLIENSVKSKNPLKFTYYIYENDVKDPGKKTKKSKLYAGYLVFEFKNSKNKTIYKVQIDFMDKKGADIANTIECSIKSFVTFTQNKKGK